MCRGRPLLVLGTRAVQASISHTLQPWWRLLGADGAPAEMRQVGTFALGRQADVQSAKTEFMAAALPPGSQLSVHLMIALFLIEHFLDPHSTARECCRTPFVDWPHRSPVASRGRGKTWSESIEGRC